MTESKIMEVYNGFPEHFKKILREKDLDARELEKKMGSGKYIIQRWLDGIGHPDMLSLMRLSNVLGVSVDEIIGLK